LQPSTQARKALFQLRSTRSADRVEAVHMQFAGGATSVCISSQVGCALGCSFCATGAIGLRRQMSADEITDQVLFFRRQPVSDALATSSSASSPVDSVSFMGMGEALQNPRLFDALDILMEPSLFGMSARRLSVSTVGVIPGIQRLTQQYPQVNLAFSLHSPFDEQRSILVPANRTYPLADCLRALEAHAGQTRRKIFLAYLVLEGVNDSPAHADGIHRLIQAFPPRLVGFRVGLGWVELTRSDRLTNPFNISGCVPRSTWTQGFNIFSMSISCATIRLRASIRICIDERRKAVCMHLPVDCAPWAASI
jgi:23S rRNA (adenine-C8)-methyltransferase